MDNQDKNNYLIDAYLNPTSSKSKKKSKSKDGSKPKLKKRKKAFIVDEDDEVNDWKNKLNSDEDEDDPIIETNSSEKTKFLSSKQSGWVTIEGEEEEEEEKEDEKPLVDSITTEEPRMSSGARYGLQSGKDVSIDIARQEKMLRQQIAAADPSQSGRGASTVYRDSKGLKVDLEDEIAEHKAKEAAKQQAEIDRKVNNMGAKQREDLFRRKRELEEEVHKPLARFADDKEYNDLLKNRPRWGDPAAKFLSKKDDEPIKPQYRGPSGPRNRFNIQPGHRWDGVDRSNGFEKELFLKMNNRKVREQEAYAWAAEDM